VDPKLIELIISGGGEAAKLLLPKLLEWGTGNEVGRLFLELEKLFGDDVPGLTAVGLHPLRGDTNFLQLLGWYWARGDFPREPMVEAIEPYLGDAPDASAHELAERVAEAIRRYSARVLKKKDREMFALEALDSTVTGAFETLREEIRTARPAARPVTVEWAPPLTRDRLRRMLEENAEALAPLEAELREAANPQEKVRELLRVPPPWLVDGAPKSWEGLGEIAEGYGLWAESATAFDKGAERPGADRVQLVSRAAVAAWIAGDKTRYQMLLGKAEKLDGHHSQVTIARALGEEDATARLALLDAASMPEEPRPAAALNIARAIAQTELGNWDAAEALIEQVRSSVPDHQGIRELGPQVVFLRNRERVAEGATPDIPALRRAAADLMVLRDDLLAAYRYCDSAKILARATQALLTADEEASARELLSQVRDEEKTDEEAALQLAAAAINLGERELARKLLPQQPNDERQHLVIAELDLLTNEAETVRRAVKELNRLMRSKDETIRAQAAFAREVAAFKSGVRRSQLAAAILKEHEPRLAVLIEADRLRSTGQTEQAESLLRPLSDDPVILRRLVQWARQDEDWERVIELSGALDAKGPSPFDRLILADALYKSEQRSEAIRIFGELRVDDAIPTEVRDESFAYSARAVSRAFDFQTLEQVTGAWLEFNPQSNRAVWNRAYALLRLARSVEALELLEQAGLEPETTDEAELLAAVLEDAGDVEAAARRIGEISDLFERPERLEALFLMTSIRVRPEARLEDLREQIQRRFTEFTERFPQSQLIRSVPIDTSPEGIDAFWREYVEPGSEHTQQVAEQLVRGEAPIAALAGNIGKPTALTTLRLGMQLPLAFGDAVLHDLERESAERAIGRSVTWDSSALTIVGSLPPEIAEAIRTTFPASLISQAILDDVNRASDPEAAGRDEYSVLGYDAATKQRFVRDWTADEVAREKEATGRALEIGRGLLVRPTVAPDKPTELDKALTDHELDLAFITWPAVLALAQREKRPIFSDDRFVRVQARRAGIEAFGTLALIDVLAGNGTITPEQRLMVRRQLRESGANGVGITLDELIAEGEESGWDISDGLKFAVLDPAAWTMPGGIETFRMWAAFLLRVFEESPESLDDWVVRILVGAKRGLPGRPYTFLAQVFLMIAWQPFQPQMRPFLHALIKALRRAVSILGWSGDPVIGAANHLAALSRSAEDPQIRGILAIAFMRDLEIEDKFLLNGIRLRLSPPG
jgi:hypothetical protein